MGCYDWWLRVVSWPSRGAHRAPEAVASPRWWSFRSRSALKKRARKRGNLSIADMLRTNVQQCTQHALDTPQNDIFSQLRTICDCPAVFLASSMRAGGQRRPFRHAFKSQMRSSRLVGVLKFTLVVRSDHASRGTPRVLVSLIWLMTPPGAQPR